MLDRKEQKQIIRETCSWRHYFSEHEVVDALVIGNNPDLLRKVKVAQQLCDDFCQNRYAKLDAELDDERAMKILGEANKPEIDVEAL